MSDDDDDIVEPTSAAQRKALFIAFFLNAGLAAGLAVTGLAADSSALIANALDNMSDAAVYAIIFYAASRGPGWKVRAARVSGVMLLVLAVAVLIDVLRRFYVTPEPLGSLIAIMAVVAAGVNILCLQILRRHRKGDVNLRAAWTFSINDMLSNLGVLLAGVLVMWIGRAWPDLVIGLVIAAVAAKGGMEILRDASRARLDEAAE